MKINRGKRTKPRTVYEFFMVLLAALSVATIWNNSQYDSYIVWITWGIFFVDFVVRFYKSDNKWNFIKSNPFLVIAIIPLDAVFQVARVARILHLLRLKAITKYYTMPFIKFLKRQHLLVVISVTFVVVFLSIIPLYLVESELDSYRDALLNSLMALTFFGRSNFEPATGLGDVIIVMLTIFGVILHGLIISTAFDYVYNAAWFKKVRGRLKKNQAS